MKVLGVVGSPRKEGNTDILVDEALRGAREAGRETEKIFLNDLRITPCQSTCTEYCEKTGDCKIKDDMSPIYNTLYDSDPIILGTPVYWYGPSAQLKAFIDRWYAFSNPQYAGRMKGKNLILIAAFEESNYSTADGLVTMIDKTAKYLRCEFSKKLLVSAGAKGIVKQNPQAMRQAYDLGLGLKSSLP
jgi:multimeric flavodoxin WrbA